MTTGNAITDANDAAELILAAPSTFTEWSERRGELINAAYRVARAWRAAMVGTPAVRKCQYCDDAATRAIRWVKAAFVTTPGPTLPYCGRCSIKDALAKRGMTAPVTEGKDYDILPLEAAR